MISREFSRKWLITLFICLFCATISWASQWTILGPDGGDVRSLSYDPHNPDHIFLGTSTGTIFSSTDGGRNWSRFAHLGSGDDYVLDHVAIDPQNPKHIFVSAWSVENQQAGDLFRSHDGGKNWEALSGMRGKSIRALAISASDSKVLVVGALDGLFRKLQGIPFSARRTRVLKQDPSNSQVVYAGTTEGLWKTMDGGKTWKQVTNSEIVVNDVLVDPRNSQHVLLATDRSGVMISDDGAKTFIASNHGYTHRYVSSILADKNDQNSILVGVVNDKAWGGVFSSPDGGQHWTQKSSGLGGRDVFALEQASNGAILAGTNRGIFLLERNTSAWRPINTIINEKTSRVTKKGSKKAVATKTAVRSVLDARVSEIEITSKRWLAATSTGVYSSSNQGKSWSGGPILGQKEFVSVQANGDVIVAATRSNVVVSHDGGTNWKQGRLASYVSSVRGLTLTPDGEILVAAREGAFRSSDSGSNWEHILNGLPD